MTQATTGVTLVFALGLILLAGCAPLLITQRAADGAQTGEDGSTAVAEQLDRTASRASAGAPTWQPGSLTSSTGCKVDYRVFRPPEASAHQALPLVVIGHGFLRSQARMQGLAEAVAQTGAVAVTLDYCNMRPWDGQHRQNGRDMVAVANTVGGALGTKTVVYTGFSAGGLAALMAARRDPHAIGVLTLDLVETGGLGVSAASQLDKPLIGLAGEPTNCNAQGNAAAVFRASLGATQYRIPGASHCDFESPTDRLCELVCADPTPTSEADADALRRQIIGQASAAIQRLTTQAP